MFKHRCLILTITEVVALFNCICKVYNTVTLFLHGNYLSTSDMQFGY